MIQADWGECWGADPTATGRGDATIASLAGDIAAGIAMLLSHDCWLRISEVAGLTVDDIVDLRAVADPVLRGVSVYLPVTKTGRRQAVRIESIELAELVVAWRTASVRAGARRMFPSPASLRASLQRALALLGAGGPEWDTRGLHFVWHSFRHGGASRAYLAGRAKVRPRCAPGSACQARCAPGEMPGGLMAPGAAQVPPRCRVYGWLLCYPHAGPAPGDQASTQLQQYV